VNLTKIPENRANSAKSKPNRERSL